MDQRRFGAFGVGIGAGIFAAWRLLRRRSVESLHGKVAVVTGGSRGLGLRVAERLAAAGCAVAICARTAEEVHAAGLELSRHGNGVFAWPCDLTDDKAAAEFIRRVEEHFGGVDILVNNAGIMQAGPVEDMTLEDFHYAVDCDFWSVVHTTMAVLPGMRAKKRGRIVNVTSIGGEVSVPHLLPYSCAKAAATSYSEGLTAELAKAGIGVTTVVPWVMRTGSMPYIFFKGKQQEEATLLAQGQRRVVSVDGDRAADRIVTAIRRGETRVIIGVLGKIAYAVHALMPAMTARLFGQVNRLMPGAPPHPTMAVRGKTLQIGQ
jgi:NAD(P)-dependent dehydrogenase (short-subunit alcohol dehydrogenase family)